MVDINSNNEERFVEHELVCRDIEHAFIMEAITIEQLSMYCKNTNKQIESSFEIGRNTVSAIIKIIY